MTTNYRHLGKYRILVAEDVELNQYLARHLMESWGLEVDIAANGREAVGLVQENNYDLVLMDIHMPEMDGLEATRRIRQLPDTGKAAVPIIALTANAIKGDREKFLAAGMNDYLSKPIDEPNLYHIIANNLTNMISTEQNTPREAVNPAAGSTGKLYDLKMVHGIAGGDEEFVRKMLRLFLDTMPQSLQDLQNETVQQHWAQVSKLAHKLKSTIDSMNIRSLKDTIREIEQYGKKGEQTAEIPALVNEVVFVMEACIAQVKKDHAL